jgi:hypothetical protein
MAGDRHGKHNTTTISFAEYLGYLTVNVAEFIRSTIIENGLMLLAGSGGEEDGEDGL